MTWYAATGALYTIIVQEVGSRSLAGLFINIEGNTIAAQNVRTFAGVNASVYLA